MRKTRQNNSISLVTCFLFCAVANAQTDVFKWTYIDVDIDVQKNGDLLISEQQEYSFEPGPSEKRHQLSRSFLMDRVDDIQDVEVYELVGNGQTPERKPLACTSEIDQNDLRLCWSCELNPPETRTFLLKYRIIAAVYVGRYNSARGRRAGRQPLDELYWNAVMWPRPAVVEKASVTVHLPSKLRGKNRSTTSFSTTAALRQDTDPDTVGFDSWREIPPEKGLQIYVGFQHGVLKIKRPSWQPNESRRRRWPSRNMTALIAVFGGDRRGCRLLQEEMPLLRQDLGIEIRRREGEPERRKDLLVPQRRHLAIQVQSLRLQGMEKKRLRRLLKHTFNQNLILQPESLPFPFCIGFAILLALLLRLLGWHR